MVVVLIILIFIIAFVAAFWFYSLPGLLIFVSGFVFGAVAWWLWMSYKSLIAKEEDKVSYKELFNRSMELTEETLRLNKALHYDLKHGDDLNPIEDRKIQ
jgi:4-hydroxybenzoate polyprenyltransferase